MSSIKSSSVYQLSDDINMSMHHNKENISLNLSDLKFPDNTTRRNNDLSDNYYERTDRIELKTKAIEPLDYRQDVKWSKEMADALCAYFESKNMDTKLPPTQ